MDHNIPHNGGKAEHTGRPASKRLNTLLKFLPDPVFAFSLDNTVEYVNPAFERVFGWTLDEIKGRNINFIPRHLLKQAKKGMKQLFLNRTVLDFETQRYTKDGRILDIIINGAILYDEHDEPIGQVLILRDVTAERRMAKTNQIMFRISNALHTYHRLGDLIALIASEIQHLVGVEGAFILLADEAADELYFFSVQFKDEESENKFKKIRFPADQGVSGHVYKTGVPLVIDDVSQCSFYLRRVDEETDLVAENMLSVPIKLKDRTIGVISVVNKQLGKFDETDTEMLMMVASTVALPIENTRINEELRKSYQDLKIMNQAKGKVIHHLAHELKTPVSVLDAAMKLLARKLQAMDIDDPQIEKIVARCQRNLRRILEIQYEAGDLLQKKDFRVYPVLKQLVAECRDAFTLLVDTQDPGAAVIEKVDQAIENIFGPETIESKIIFPGPVLSDHLQHLSADIAHRSCTLNTGLEKTGPVRLPPRILDIIITGLIRNAVEYTPDGSRIDIILTSGRENGPELVVRDHGIGITKEKMRLMFENYFTPPESADYTTRSPYDFNAGGRGLDLLRIKLFSEQYEFILKIDSTRCVYIPADTDICPGDVRSCPFCSTPDDCLESGGTLVKIVFSGPANG